LSVNKKSVGRFGLLFFGILTAFQTMCALEAQHMNHALAAMAAYDAMSRPTQPTESPDIPKPDHLAVMVEAVKNGGRVRVEIRGDQALEWNSPHRILWEKNASRAEDMLNSRLPLLETQVAKSYASIRLKSQIHLIFTEASKIGNPESFLGFEIQIRLPVSLDPQMFLEGVKDFHRFYTPEANLVISSSDVCLEFMRKLI